MSGHYVVTVEVELQSHRGQWTVHMWSERHHTFVMCDPSKPNDALREALSEHAMVDGFALDGSDT